MYVLITFNISFCKLKMFSWERFSKRPSIKSQICRYFKLTIVTRVCSFSAFVKTLTFVGFELLFDALLVYLLTFYWIQWIGRWSRRIIFIKLLFSICIRWDWYHCVLICCFFRCQCQCIIFVRMIFSYGIRWICCSFVLNFWFLPLRFIRL